MDVEKLEIYLGNDNPGYKTFEAIVPKFKRGMTYWKQFSVSKVGKSRVA